MRTLLAASFLFVLIAPAQAQYCQPYTTYYQPTYYVPTTYYYPSYCYTPPPVYCYPSTTTYYKAPSTTSYNNYSTSSYTKPASKPMPRVSEYVSYDAPQVRVTEHRTFDRPPVVTESRSFDDDWKPSAPSHKKPAVGIREETEPYYKPLYAPSTKDNFDDIQKNIREIQEELRKLQATLKKEAEKKPAAPSSTDQPPMKKVEAKEPEVAPPPVPSMKKPSEILDKKTPEKK